MHIVKLQRHDVSLLFTVPRPIARQLNLHVGDFMKLELTEDRGLKLTPLKFTPKQGVLPTKEAMSHTREIQK